MNSTLIKPRGRMPKTAKDKVKHERRSSLLTSCISGWQRGCTEGKQDPNSKPGASNSPDCFHFQTACHSCQGGLFILQKPTNWQFDHSQVHESKVKNDFKAAAGAEKPRQLFWEKRLNGEKFWFRSSLIAIFPGMGAKSVAADQFAMELPGSIKRLQAVIGEEVVKC